MNNPASARSSSAPAKANASRRQSGFNFTSQMRVLCTDMIARVDALQHIDLSRVAIAFAQARKATSYGVFASLTPLRFEGGALTKRRRGRDYAVQRLFAEDGREMLYILTFYLPRFMDLPFDEKLVTIFHELWHISPNFDGDLRRHPGRCYAHTQSQKEYDAEMAELARQWLADGPPPPIYQFLNGNFQQLSLQHGRVFGVRIPRPKLLPVR